MTALHKLSLENFTVFQSLDVDFSPHINVILGANASGKTHLLKLLYATTRAFTTASPLDRSKSAFATHLTKRLIRNFQVDRAGRLASRVKGHKHSSVLLETAKNTVSFDFSTRHTEVKVEKYAPNYEGEDWPEAVYIPTKEILSMFTGLVPAIEAGYIDVEELYHDLGSKLGRNVPSGGPSKWRTDITKHLENVLDAKVIFDEKTSRFYIKQRGLGNIEAGLAAEGHRKIGMLLQLVANGTLGENSVLFWDEPESNMNPEHARHVVELLSHLSNSGIQVFVTTHDYFILKQITLKTKKHNLKAKYVSLSKKQKNRFATYQTAENIYDLEPNPIIDEFDRLYQDQRQLFYGGSRD